MPPLFTFKKYGKPQIGAHTNVQLHNDGASKIAALMRLDQAQHLIYNYISTT